MNAKKCVQCTRLAGTPYNDWLDLLLIILSECVLFREGGIVVGMPAMVPVKLGPLQSVRPAL